MVPVARVFFLVQPLTSPSHIGHMGRTNFHQEAVWTDCCQWLLISQPSLALIHQASVCMTTKLLVGSRCSLLAVSIPVFLHHYIVSYEFTTYRADMNNINMVKCSIIQGSIIRGCSSAIGAPDG